MKKVVSFILAVIMAVGMMSAVAFASETTVNIVVDKEWDDSHIPGAIRPESIIVNLLENGVPVDEAELNENNNWHYEWYKPEMDDSGMPIVYTIEETDVPGYSSTVTSNEIPGTVKRIEFVITNTYVGTEPQTARIVVNKTDDKGQPLADAYFTLTEIENGFPKAEPAYEAKSDANGVATFIGVVEGSYVLEESAAPNGYIKSEEKYSLYVRDDGSVVVFSDLAPNGAPYRAVTFINNPVPFGVETETVEVPFAKYVDQIGTKAPGKMTFEFEIYDFCNTNANQNFTITQNTIKTDGYGRFEGKLVFEVEDIDIICEGFFVKEKKENVSGWTYSDEIWYVCPDANGEWDFFEVVNGEIDYDNSFEEMAFINYFYMNEPSAPNNPERPGTEIIITSTPNNGDEANPNTGAPVFGMIVLMAAIAVICKK